MTLYHIKVTAIIILLLQLARDTFTAHEISMALDGSLASIIIPLLSPFCGYAHVIVVRGRRPGDEATTTCRSDQYKYKYIHVCTSVEI